MSEALSSGVDEILPVDTSEPGAPALEVVQLESHPAWGEARQKATRKLGELSLGELEAVAQRAETGLDGVGTSLVLFAPLNPDQYWRPDYFFKINSMIIRSVERIIVDLSEHEMEMQLALDEEMAVAWNRQDNIVPINRATDSQYRVPTTEAFHIGYKAPGSEDFFWYAFSDVCAAVKKGAPLQLVHKPSGRIMHEYVWEEPGPRPAAPGPTKL